jgi:hypothetical protein
MRLFGRACEHAGVTVMQRRRADPDAPVVPLRGSIRMWANGKWHEVPDTEGHLPAALDLMEALVSEVEAASGWTFAFFDQKLVRGAGTKTVFVDGRLGCRSGAVFMTMHLELKVTDDAEADGALAKAEESIKAEFQPVFADLGAGKAKWVVGQQRVSLLAEAPDRFGALSVSRSTGAWRLAVYRARGPGAGLGGLEAGHAGVLLGVAAAREARLAQAAAEAARAGQRTKAAIQRLEQEAATAAARRKRLEAERAKALERASAERRRRQREAEALVVLEGLRRAQVAAKESLKM